MHSDHTVSIRVNGEHRRVTAGLSIAQLAADLGLAPKRSRSSATSKSCRARPLRRSVSRMATNSNRPFRRRWRSCPPGRRGQLDGRRPHLPLAPDRRHRQVQGYAQNAAALEASGAEIVTVAVRRVNISDRNRPMLTDFIDPKKITYLPNTAGCFTAEDANPHAAPGPRGGRLGSGQARSAG